MAEQLAVHLEPETGRVLGVWTSPTECAYLPDRVGGLHRSRGAAVMADKVEGYPWADWVRELAQRWPVATWWETVPRRGSETAKDALYRVVAEAHRRKQAGEQTG